jgi:hypothetical protein
MKSKRGGAVYCSRQCKNSARRARKRVDTQRAGHPSADEIRESAALTEAYANERSPDPIDLDDDEHQDEEQGIVAGDAGPRLHETDIRFAAMIEKGHARGGPSRGARKAWRQHGTRHGTEHPGQTADRLARHQADVDARTARLDSMTAGRVQDRFDDRTRPNVGRNGADSRRLNRRFLPDDDMPRPSPGFDFTNETTDGGPFTRGRPVGQRGGSADYAWNMRDGW